MSELTKKKSRFKVFLEGSAMIRALFICIGIALFGFLNYGLAKWECSLAQPNFNMGLIRFMFANILILLLLICLVVPLIDRLMREIKPLSKYCFIPHAEEDDGFCNLISILLTNIVFCEMKLICKLKALGNYCYLPLTKDEVRSFSFVSAGEYFNYVSQMLRYEKKKNSTGKAAQHVQIRNSDLNKMLAVCLEVFSDNGTIFSLLYKDYSLICNMYCSDFVQFLASYHEAYKNDRNYVPSANISEDGTVRLSVLNKDGLGIVWNGGEMYEINEEEVG